MNAKRLSLHEQLFLSLPGNRQSVSSTTVNSNTEAVSETATFYGREDIFVSVEFCEELQMRNCNRAVVHTARLNQRKFPNDT